MEIKNKGSKDVKLATFEEFYDYVTKDIIKNLKYDFESKLYDYYNATNFVSGIKKFRNEIKELYFNTTILNINYWLSRGWTNDEAIEKIHETQKIRSNVFKDKMSKLKDTDYNKWCEKQNTKKEFYLKKGMNNEEASLALSKRQKTFSIDICLEKYGDDGYKIWQERQTKWYESIKNIVCDRDSCSATYNKNKFGDEWIINAIKRNAFLNGDIILEIISKTKNDFIYFIQEYSKIKTILSLNDVYFLYNSKILQDYFQLNNQQMNIILRKELNINIKSFGNVRYFNNHICRSNGEYYIAKKLLENNIFYIYEKKYPNSTYVSDFYIPEIDLYIEYLGMMKSKYFEIYQTKLYFEYKDRYDKKEKYCVDNNINYLYDSNMIKIVETIKNIIQNGKN
jgi:hypothetical protein